MATARALFPAITGGSEVTLVDSALSLAGVDSVLSLVGVDSVLSLVGVATTEESLPSQADRNKSKTAIMIS
ncbi:hypothetical protein D1Z90_19350 [Motilimonas pumila]|uniref:Uncharacterized protein n=1 Tax=Motilimonas pumila TaxID=2303987 RepID=A0A418Y9Q4_9GAMM|nr:hypothetical protein D1Z90_19350 [Motilimonas pumila]